MEKFKQYRRTQIAEMREVVEADIILFQNHAFFAYI